MFAKVSILLLVAAVAHSQLISSYSTGGIPVYRNSALYGGLYGANGFGYGANLGRVAGLGALRTSGAIVGTGGLGYGLGYGYGLGRSAVIGAPAVSTIGVNKIGAVGLGLAGLGVAARGINVHQAGPVNAAVTTLARTVDYKPIPYTGEPAVVQDIDVPPQESPLRINFQSKSSPLQVTQQHIPAEPGQVQVTQSEDEPHQLVHNVARSVHQQVNEIVQPYRTLTQTVEPVIEQTHTNIAQGEGVRLTGLQSGIVGGTGVLGASGIGIAAPAVGAYGVGIARPVGLGLGVAKSYGVGLGGYGSLLGSRLAGVYGTGLSTGLSNIYGGYGTGLVGGLRSYGLGGYGYGSGLGLTGLSGLSTYGTTAKIGRIY